VVTPRTVFVDARVVRPGATGVGQYTGNLLRALDAVVRARGVRLVALRLRGAAHPAWNDLQHTEVVETTHDYETHPTGDLFLHRTLPRLAASYGADLLVSPAFLAPLVAARGASPVRRMVFVHDLFAFDPVVPLPGRFRWYLRAMVSGALSRCEVVATSSAVTRGALAARSGQRPLFAPPGIDHTVFRPRARTASLPDGSRRRAPVLVYTASFEPRKDHRTLLAAVRDLDVDLVLLHGGHWTGAPLPPSVRHVIPRNASDIAAWTAAADVAVFPSRIEGFGIPMLEAMACGTPLVASDTAAARWLTGSGRAARLVAIGDIAGWRDALVSATAAPDRQSDERVTAGIRRARAFTWERAAQRVLAGS